MEFCHFCTKFPLCSLLLFDGCNAPINLLLAIHGIAIKCRCGLACFLPLKNGVSLFISHRSTLAQLSLEAVFFVLSPDLHRLISTDVLPPATPCPCPSLGLALLCILGCKCGDVPELSDIFDEKWRFFAIFCCDN